jgi:signal recognition particle subunit SRP54
VVDSLTGQDAVNVAKSFDSEVPDRRDPHPDGRRCPRRRGAVDARGHRQADQVRRHRRGARRARGVPPGAVAGRILGMGDVVSLVEKAAETIKMEEAEKLAAKMAKGKFDLERPSRMQIQQMQRMGGLGALAG